jgi:hypothetical protein
MGRKEVFVHSWRGWNNSPSDVTLDITQLFDLETAELLEQLVQAWPTPLSLDRWSAQQLHTAQALYDKGILKTL